MSSRKDNIKKSLGITEYPWSSDDDDNEASSTMPDVHLLRNVFDGKVGECRSNVNLPGTSAGSSQVDHIPTPAAPFPVKKSQAKIDRETFWSLIDGRGQGSLPQTSGVNRSDVTQLPFSRTMSHVPAEELRSSSDRGSTVAEIKRMIAIKKLTRTLHRYRPSKSGHGMNTTRGASGSSKSTPVFNPSLDLASAQSSCQIKSKKQNSGHSASTSFKRSNGSGGGGSSRSPQPGSSGVSHRQASDAAPATLHIYHSDSDVEMGRLENSTPKQGNDVNEAQEEIVQDSSVGQVSLEEIVEIDAEPDASTTAENGDTSANEHAGNDSTDNAGNAAESNQEAQQRQHGVKRKREGTGDSSEHSSEPSTLKELNSSLLRLLECPVCLEWMEPPMSQCRRGHLVCGRCRARLASCPVCRTAFSSLRNRAMEGVAEMLRYPCRHGCGREVRLRRRTPHEASCHMRRYPCPAPVCAARAPLPLAELHKHTQAKHPAMVRIGRKHKISVKLSMEQHDNWFVLALQELFHLRLDVLRPFGVVVYVAYIGPKKNAHNFIYEVTVTGQHNSRKLIYARATHSDLESSSLNVTRQDCFYLTLDQALNFLRVKNRHSETDNTLEFNIEITKSEPTSANVREDSDS